MAAVDAMAPLSTQGPFIEIDTCSSGSSSSFETSNFSSETASLRFASDFEGEEDECPREA